MASRKVLTIAASDSGGWSGAQADLRTITALGCFATSAITALAAQNTQGIQRIQLVDPSFVEQQIDAVLADGEVAAVKIGLVADRETFDRLAARAADGQFPNLVVDPLLLTGNGQRVVPPETAARYAASLFPHATFATVGREEAELLLGFPVRDIGEGQMAARRLAELGASYVIITDVSPADDQARDLLSDGTDVTELRTERVDSRDLHGLGSTFSAALAALLAQGHDPIVAAVRAKEYLVSVLRGADRWKPGPPAVARFSPVRLSRSA